MQDQPTFEYDETCKITGYKTKVGADTVFPFKGDSDFFKVVRMYNTAAAMNATYTAYQTYFVIPKANLKSISFTCNNMSNSATNDVVNYNLPCVFIGSVVSYDTLLQNGVNFITPARNMDTHKSKTVIYHNGTYSFDDFSDCYDYVVFGFGTTATYSRYYLTNVSIELI